MAYKRQEDNEESQPFLSNTANDPFNPASVEMRVMGAQQQPTHAHIPQGYYLPHAGDNLHQQQQQQQQQYQQQQPYAFTAPPPHYSYDHTQLQHQPLPFHPPPYASPPPFAYAQQCPVEEPFVPADPNLRNEFLCATAGFFIGFFLPIVWCSGWFFFRSHQRGTRAFARASLACICISVVIAALFLMLFVFAMFQMAPMAQCLVLNGQGQSNSCSSCASIQGCAWCPSASACMPIFVPRRDGDSRNGRQPHVKPMCNGSQGQSQLIASPIQCPAAPSAPALSPSP